MTGRTPRRRTTAVLAVLAVAAVVASCSGSGDGDGGSADAERRVVLLTYDSFALPEGAAETFRRETGARIEVRTRGDSGSVLTSALLSAGSPEADVIFGIDDTSATRVTDEDLLEPYTPAAAATVAEDLRLPGELGELLTPVDRGDVCVNVDAEWFAEQGLAPPSTFADLVDARYRDLLVVPSPVTSSPGLAFLVGTVGATDDWAAYWEQLRAAGVRVRPSWDDAYFTDYTVSGGDRPLVVSYATSPPAEVLLGEDGRTEPRSTVAVGTCVGQVEYAGVLRGTERPELARRLVDFMLSPQWQSELPAANFVLPVVAGTPLPEEFERFVPEVDPVRVDPLRVGREREDWIERWRSIME
jgi:thiamine transport system substrate-binding protein